MKTEKKEQLIRHIKQTAGLYIDADAVEVKETKTGKIIITIKTEEK